MPQGIDIFEGYSLEEIVQDLYETSLTGLQGDLKTRDVFPLIDYGIGHNQILV